MTEDEKQEKTIHSERNTNEKVNKVFCKYSLISEIVVLVGFIVGYSWITAYYWGTAYLAVIGFHISLKFWEIIVLAVFSLIGLSNSLLYIFLMFPKPKRVIILRWISFGICLVGAVLNGLLAPFGIGSQLALFSPLISTASVFFVKPLRKRKGIRKDSTAQ
jgi:F0F1-type ATP synthase assembly protein I